MNNTIHAEEAAVYKLPTLPRNRPLKSVNILVIKTSKTGCWGNSKPCYNCICVMNNIAPLKGYRINKVYYTNESRNIESCKLNDLVNDPEKYLTKYYRERA